MEKSIKIANQNTLPSEKGEGVSLREAARQFITANGLIENKGLVIAFYGKMGAGPPPSPSSMNTASPPRGLFIISISTASRSLRKSMTWATKTISTAVTSVS